jgi:hypothetical protein
MDAHEDLPVLSDMRVPERDQVASSVSLQKLRFYEI